RSGAARDRGMHALQVAAGRLRLVFEIEHRAKRGGVRVVLALAAVSQAHEVDGGIAPAQSVRRGALTGCGLEPEPHEADRRLARGRMGDLVPQNEGKLRFVFENGEESGADDE